MTIAVDNRPVATVEIVDPIVRAMMNAEYVGSLPDQWHEALRAADAEIARGEVVHDKEVRRTLRDLDRDR